MSDPPKGHDMMTNLRQKNTLSFVHTVLYEYTRANSILHPSLSIYSPPMHAPLTININCSDFKIYSRFLLYIFCQCCPFYSICRQSMKKKFKNEKPLLWRLESRCHFLWEYKRCLIQPTSWMVGQGWQVVHFLAIPPDGILFRLPGLEPWPNTLNNFPLNSQ